MLKELQNYVKNETVITAEDMNSCGGAVKIINGVAAGLGFADAIGLVFRNAPNKLETVLARLGVLHTSGTNNLGLEWSQVAPNTNGAFVTVTGGLTSSGTNDLAVPGDWTKYTPDAVVLLRKAYDPATGARTWGFQAGGGGGSGLREVFITATNSAGLYVGQLLAPYTNTATIGAGLIATLTGIALESGEVWVGNWHEYNNGTGEVLKVNAVYMCYFYAAVNHTARATLYMVQSADGVVCTGA